MKYKRLNTSWIIVLEKSDKIIDKLTEFVRKENIKSGYFSGIGAVNNAELAHFSCSHKEYSSKLLTESLEIVSLSGNVAYKDNDIVIHAHAALGTKDMVLYGGHLKEAEVSATCEIIFNEFNIKINRKHNKDIGLNLMDL